MEPFLKAVFSDLPIQWAGWACFAVLAAYVVRTVITALNNNTAAVTKLVVLIEERLPRGGG